MNISDQTRKWDIRFLELARLVSTWSKDPSTQVGAVIVDADKRIVSVGYNGFPKGIEDDDARLDNRELKYHMIIHAERNALLFSELSRVRGGTLYTWPFPTCAPCTSIFIQAGVARTVAPGNIPDNWRESIILGERLKEEANILNEVIPWLATTL